MNSVEFHGLCASTIATCACFPLDTWKMKIQAQQPMNFASSYRGLLPELAGSIPSSLSYWFTYNQLRKQNTSIFLSSVSGAAISNFVDTAFDIRKKQRQLQLPTTQIWGEWQKIRKFSAVNVAHSCMYNGIYMPLLDFLHTKHGYNKTFSIFLCCTIANTLTYPLDRWRTRIVTNQPLAPFLKGLGTRLLYGNIYSGLYMHIFLWLNQGI